MRGQTGQVGRTLRRSLALALALTAAWVTLRTSGVPDTAQALQELSQDAVFAVSLLRTQLPGGRAGDDGLTGWPRLVISQSPVLRADLRTLSAPPDGGLSQPSDPLPQDKDDEPPISSPTDQTNIIPKTMVPSAAQSYLTAGDIYIANRADKKADVAALASAPVNITLGAGPQILILHSHGSEAYTPSGSDTYQESDPYRTTDCNYNVVRVGEEMARVFRDRGFQVIHDTTLYDYPSYNEAYTRSLAAAERWLTQYPSIQVVLDVHRDALTDENGTIYKAVSQEDGAQAAQVMLVVGTDGTGKHSLWKENLTFGIHLQQQLLADHQTLARPMVLRASRFNQHLSVGSLLVEVGTHGNTLQEALLGARLFAQSTAKVLQELK